jgi:Cu(I)/Ag(I) efflux system membrane fusion protein
MEVYSPELLTAQQNLIFLLKNDPGNISLIIAAKDRLILLGMSASQVNQITGTRTPIYSVPVFSNYTGFVTDLDERPLENMSQQNQSANQELRIKEGMYVKPGETVFSVYNPGRAWVLLDIFPEQQLHVGVGSAVKIIPETAPHEAFNARIDYVEPVFRPGSKTLTARVNINNASLKLPIGSRVTASIFTKSKIAQWLPKEAVLSLGRDHIVFKKEEGGLRARRISTGIELNEYIQVTAGLQLSDSVAANARFLVDNEAFIKVKSK